MKTHKFFIIQARLSDDAWGQISDEFSTIGLARVFQFRHLQKFAKARCRIMKVTITEEIVK